MRSLVFCLTVLSYVVLSTQKKNAKVSNRIVGGEEISITKAPYQVALLINNENLCGAVIIAPKTVLSAAHCYVENSEIDFYKIRAGSSYHAQGGEVRQVVEFRSHEKYDSEANDYDIAILKLKRNLEFNDKIASIKMKNEGDTVPNGDKLFVSGWGLLKDDRYDLKPEKLHGVSVEKVSTETCKDLYAPTEITPRMICAGRGSKDSCVGDSGGPAVHNHLLAGIVSFGRKCAGREPGVYTKVSVFRKWIDKHMKEFEGRGFKQSILQKGTLV